MRSVGKILHMGLSAALIFLPCPPAGADCLAPPSAFQHGRGFAGGGPDGSYPAGFPVYRKVSKVPKGYISSIEREIASGNFDAQGRVQMDHDPQGFFNGSRQRLMHKIVRVFRKYDVRYRELIPQIRLTVVEDGYHLIRVRKDPQGRYEIVMDRSLLELSPHIDPGPLLLIAFNHEFNHPEVRETHPGHLSDPIVEEMAVNITDHVTYSQMTPIHRGMTIAALEDLEKKGFLAAPYIEFLRGPPTPVLRKREKSPPKEFCDRHVRELFVRALAISTHPEANAKYHAHLLELQKHYHPGEGVPSTLKGILALHPSGKRKNGTGKKITAPVTGYSYRGVASKLRKAHRSGRLLYTVLDEIEDALRGPMASYNSYVDRLFTRFDLSVYKSEGLVNQDTEKAILERDLPRIVQIGGQHVLRRLEDILATSDYSIVLRMAVAKAIIAIHAEDEPASVRNPFFIRDLIEHSRYLRSKANPRVLGSIRLKHLSTLLGLLGNYNPESRRIYLDTRNELVNWVLYGQRIMRQLVDKKTKKVRLKDQEQFMRAKKLADVAENMLRASRKNLSQFLGTKGWQGSIEYAEVADDPLKGIARAGAKAEDPGVIAMEQQLAKKAFLGIRHLIKNTNALRESLFIQYGQILEELPSDHLTVSFENNGAYKFVYKVMLRRADGQEYRFAWNFVQQDNKTAVEKPKKKTPVGDAPILNEMHRLALSQSPYERITGEWEFMGHIHWSEEYVEGISLDQSPTRTYLERGSNESLNAWIVRVLMAIREYSRVSWSTWAAEGGEKEDVGIDNNPWNVRVMPDGTQRIIDAGLKTL